LPRETVAYLHALVGRAHNAVYRAQGFRVSDWADALFGTVPRRLRSDPALRLAALAFYGSFLICALLGAGRPEFASRVIGEPSSSRWTRCTPSRSAPVRQGDGPGRNDTMMTGFYIQHNTTIGLQCFAWGLFFGLGSLYGLLSNSMILGRSSATWPPAPPRRISTPS
jgi:hypothetical protein